MLEDDLVTFRCFATATPLPSVNWVHNSTVLSYGDKYRLGSSGINFGALSIYNTNFYDRGLYTCRYNNTHGSDSFSATLTVQGKYVQCACCA